MKRSDIPDEHVIALARATFEAGGPGVVTALVAEGIPVNLARAKVEHMVDRHLLGYGVSLDTAWTADHGPT